MLLSFFFKVESLQAQLAEQAKLSKEQYEALVEDRRVKEEEFETRRQRDEEKIRTLTEKYKYFSFEIDAFFFILENFKYSIRIHRSSRIYLMVK